MARLNLFSYFDAGNLYPPDPSRQTLRAVLANAVLKMLLALFAAAIFVWILTSRGSSMTERLLAGAVGLVNLLYLLVFSVTLVRYYRKSRRTAGRGGK